VAVAAPAEAAEQPGVADLPPALRDAITSLHPAAAVLRADEILVERCGAEHGRDQVVRADLNGDGRADYAVLLRIGEPKAVAGEALKSASVWAVVFLARRDGLYRSFILSKRDDVMIPSRLVLALRPAGRVQSGVSRRACSRSSSPRSRRFSARGRRGSTTGRVAGRRSGSLF
jgi:hypothetical protein